MTIRRTLVGLSLIAVLGMAGAGCSDNREFVVEGKVTYDILLPNYDRRGNAYYAHGFTLTDGESLNIPEGIEMMVWTVGEDVLHEGEKYRLILFGIRNLNSTVKHIDGQNVLIPQGLVKSYTLLNEDLGS